MSSKKILITGGAGFICSHVVRTFVEKYPDYQIYNLDALTYAGNLENIKDIETSSNYTFINAKGVYERTFIKSIGQEIHRSVTGIFFFGWAGSGNDNEVLSLNPKNYCSIEVDF